MRYSSSPAEIYERFTRCKNANKTQAEEKKTTVRKLAFTYDPMNPRPHKQTHQLAATTEAARVDYNLIHIRGAVHGRCTLTTGPSPHRRERLCDYFAGATRICIVCVLFSERPTQTAFFTSFAIGWFFARVLTNGLPAGVVKRLFSFNCLNVRTPCAIRVALSE